MIASLKKLLLNMVIEGDNKSLRTAKLIQMVLIIAVLFYIYLLIKLPFPLIAIEGNTLNSIVIILAILSIVSLVYCYYFPRLMSRGYVTTPVKIESRLLTLSIIRSSTLEAIGIWGLLLGILGAGTYIVLAFFIVAIAGLVITFPGKNKWNRLATMIRPPAD